METDFRVGDRIEYQGQLHPDLAFDFIFRKIALRSVN